MATARLDARLIRDGGEFLVNLAPGHQRFPEAVARPDGGFVIVWETGAAGFGRTRSIAMRRFAADAAPLSDPVLLDPDGGDQVLPRIASTDDGRMLVVWTNTTASTVMGRTIGTDGVPSGPPFLLTDDALAIADDAAVAVGPHGSFLVTWRDGGGSADVIRIRRFSAAGAPIGPSFPVTVDTGNASQFHGRIASAPDRARFMVAWINDPPGGPLELRGRVFAADTPVSDDFAIAPAISYAVDVPSLCARDTEFVAIWATVEGDVADRDHPARVRRYDASGGPLTPPFRLTPEQMPVQQYTPHCAGADPLIATWKEDGGLRGRVVEHGDFRIRGGRYAVGASTAIVLSDGRVLAIWDDCRLEDYCNLFGQVIGEAAAPECPGDCNGDGTVRIDELTRIVKLVLDPAPSTLKTCLAADASFDYTVTVDEAITAVSSALSGCD